MSRGLSRSLSSENLRVQIRKTLPKKLVYRLFRAIRTDYHKLALSSGDFAEQPFRILPFHSLLLFLGIDIHYFQLAIQGAFPFEEFVFSYAAII